MPSKHPQSQTVRARDLTIWENVHLPPSVNCHMSHVMCQVSPVTCHMSCVTCHMSLVMCHVSPVACHLSHQFFFRVFGATLVWITLKWILEELEWEGLLTRDMWHMTCDKWHVTGDTWHFFLFFTKCLKVSIKGNFIVLVLLPGHVKIFSVSRMQDFKIYLVQYFNAYILS